MVWPSGSMMTPVLYCFVLGDFEKQGRMYMRMTHLKIEITSGRDCGLAEWINL